MPTPLRDTPAICYGAWWPVLEPSLAVLASAFLVKERICCFPLSLFHLHLFVLESLPYPFLDSQTTAPLPSACQPVSGEQVDDRPMSKAHLL